MFKKTFIAASLLMAFQSTAAEIQLHNGSMKAIINQEMQRQESLGSAQQLFRLPNILNEAKHQALFEQYLQGKSFYSPLVNTIIQFNESSYTTEALSNKLKVYQKFGDYCQDLEQISNERGRAELYQQLIKDMVDNPLLDVERETLQIYAHELPRPFSFHQVDFKQTCKTYTADQIESFKHPETNNNYAPLLELYVKDIQARYPFLQRDNQTIDLDKYLTAKTLTHADYLQRVQQILTELDDRHNNYTNLCTVVNKEGKCNAKTSFTEFKEKVKEFNKQKWSERIKEIKASKAFIELPLTNDVEHHIFSIFFSHTYAKTQLNLEYQEEQKTPQIGYINLSSFAIYEDQAGASYEEFKHNVIDTMLQQMADQTDALIIDVRINGGGHGRNPIDLAEKFMDWSQRTQAERTNGVPLMKMVAKGESHLDVKPYLVKPSTDSVRYSKPVILLTSPNTVSAADYFTVAMKELAQDVTLVGQKTPAFYSPVANITGISASNGDFSWISTQLTYLHGQNLERDELGHLRGISPKPENIIEDMPYSTYYTEESPAFKRAFEIIQSKLEAKNTAESSLD
jgi:hypothetical protein